MFKKAERKQAKLRLGIDGPSGSGKTYGALLIAKGMGGKVAVIDTEEGSASLYSDLCEFDVAELRPPFEPERYVKLIKGAEQAGYDTIIIDSGSHEWMGSGGILEIHDAMPGNSYTNWSKVNPRHEAFVQAILRSPCHIICTLRSKQKHELVETNGKKEVKKLGMGAQQREGVEYELTTVLSMNAGKANGTKDRTGLFQQDHWFTITEDTGRTIAGWLNSGKEVLPEPINVDGLRAAVKQWGMEQLDAKWTSPDFAARYAVSDKAAVDAIYQQRKQELEAA